MAYVSPIQFARTVQEACDRSVPVIGYDIQILDDTVVKIRATLEADTFIEVFYNADTGKCSYALIKDAMRVFGADNAFIGWHIHPFEDPSEHVASSELSFQEFLEAVEGHLA